MLAAAPMSVDIDEDVRVTELEEHPMVVDNQSPINEARA